MARNLSAGMLLFRRRGGGIELFLAHPGGPYWRNKELGAWSLPKGIIEDGEEPLAAARREFREETGIEPQAPFLDLGEIRQKGGKRVSAWAWEGDADPDAIVSNTMQVEWPPRSGRTIELPEVDRCAWFDPDTARQMINAAQAELIDRLLERLE